MILPSFGILKCLDCPAVMDVLFFVFSSDDVRYILLSGSCYMEAGGLTWIFSGFFMETQVEPLKNPGWLGYIRDYTTQLNMGIIISHYKDPY